MTLRLALIRHGHTAWNRAGRIQGRTDIPLDAAARDELSALRLPAPWDAAQITASPLKRASETARLVSGRDPILAPELIEMDWGQWEGQHGAALRDDPACAYRDIEHWGLGFCPPGGESIAALQARVLSWAEGLEQDTLAVCHIGVMRAFLAAATGWTFEGAAPFAIKRARLYVLTRAGAGWHWDGQPIRLIKDTACA